MKEQLWFLVYIRPSPDMVWNFFQTAMCVQNVGVHVSCSSHVCTQLAAFFIDPRAEWSTTWGKFFTHFIHLVYPNYSLPTLTAWMWKTVLPYRTHHRRTHNFQAFFPATHMMVSTLAEPRNSFTSTSHNFTLEIISPSTTRISTSSNYINVHVWAFWRLFNAMYTPQPAAKTFNSHGLIVRAHKLSFFNFSYEKCTVMILPQVHLRKPCYDFYFL